jgi:hypothetical protein
VEGCCRHFCSRAIVPPTKRDRESEKGRERERKQEGNKERKKKARRTERRRERKKEEKKERSLFENGVERICEACKTRKEMRNLDSWR